MTTWGETKRARNLAKHGVDLAIAAHFEFITAEITEDSSEAYGERRERAVGVVGDTLYVYVYTLDEDGDDHAISLRRRSGAGMSKAKRKVSALTPEEMLEVERRRAELKARLRAASHDEVEPKEVDPENPPLTDRELDGLRPAHEVHPELVAKQLRTSSGYARANIPADMRDKVEVNKTDGSVTADVGTISKVTLDNIIDVRTHLIMREEISFIHFIEFYDGGSVKIVYTNTGAIKEFVGRGISFTLTPDKVAILGRMPATLNSSTPPNLPRPR